MHSFGALRRSRSRQSGKRMHSFGALRRSRSRQSGKRMHSFGALRRSTRRRYRKKMLSFGTWRLSWEDFRQRRELPETEPGGLSDGSGSEAQWEAGHQQEREPVQLKDYYNILVSDEVPLAGGQQALQQDETPVQQSGASEQKEGKKEQRARGRRQRGNKFGGTNGGKGRVLQLKKSDEAKEVGGDNRKDGGAQLRKSDEVKKVEAVAIADGQAEHCGSEAGCNVDGAKEMGKAATEDGQAKRCCGEDGQGQGATRQQREQKCAAAGPGETGEEGGGFKLHGYERGLHGRWLMARDRARSRPDVKLMCEEDMPLANEFEAYLFEVGSKNRGRRAWLCDLFYQDL
mmetsp:Transcript_16335/g.36225  ORF Transcript_16335/g.36225 Transcript_16335/m.36225 type:complete len:344 (-) Transcript_16335:227-1258(-)